MPMIELFEDIEAGSSIGCAALVPSPPFKRKQRRWNFSEGFIPVLDVVQSTSQARNTADLNCSGPNLEVQEESIIYDPAGNFLNRGICLVCTQEELLGHFCWKMKAFWVCLLYSGSIDDLQ